MGAPIRIGADMGDGDHPAAFAGLIADGLLDLELVAGVEAEFDPVLHLAADPAMLGDPRDRGKSHAGNPASLGNNVPDRVVIALCRDFGGESVLHQLVSVSLSSLSA